MRSAHTGVRVLVYGLLCFAVLMQMLGTPATLWSLDFDSDLPNSSTLEELSLPPDDVSLNRVESSQLHVQALFRRPPIVFEHILLRPPSRRSSSSAI